MIRYEAQNRRKNVEMRQHRNFQVSVSSSASVMSKGGLSNLDCL